MHPLLRSPKWLAGHALVLIVVVLFTNLGFWQLRRLEEARTHNAVLAERLASAPVSLAEGLASGRAYVRVEAEGRFLAGGQLLTAPRSRDGAPGHHVLTPLETAEGTVLVDRGWVPFERDGVADAAVAAPEGEQRVTGLLVPAEQGAAGEADTLLSIDPAAATERTGVALHPSSYLQLEELRPSSAGGPLPHAQPVLDEGNHRSYAVQWFLFTLVVLVGYPLLLRRTLREQARGDGPGTPGAAVRQTSSRDPVPTGDGAS